MGKFCTLLLTIFACLLENTKSEDLTAVVANGKLPIGTYRASSVYDGKESIYIFGGIAFDGHVKNEIYEYSLTSDAVTQVASLPIALYGGGAVLDEQRENIYHVGGYDNRAAYGEVFKYNIASKSVSKVGAMSTPVHMAATIRYKSQIFTIGGLPQASYTQCWDISKQADCSTQTLGTTFYGATAVAISNQAYIFGPANGAKGGNPVCKANLDTFKIVCGQPVLPKLSEYPSSVTDGNNANAYIIGGWNTDSKFAFHSLIKVDLATLTPTVVPVNNYFPNEAYLIGPSAVFVKNLNRIYVIGGFTYPGHGPHDEILYIELAPSLNTTTTTQSPQTSSTIDPSLFSCNDKPNGFYPHSIDCSKFIGCRDSVATVHKCTESLLFDPIKKQCNFPDLVECSGK